MSKVVRKARLLGALLAATAFALGVAIGALMWPRAPRMQTLMVTATNAVPTELTALGLSEAQRAQLGPILLRGRDRVIRVVDRFTPVVQAALDTTDTEIRAILTQDQRRQFDSVRAANPALRRVLRKH